MRFSVLLFLLLACGCGQSSSQDLVTGSLASSSATNPVAVADFTKLPVDPAGYTIERLPFVAYASFVRGSDVYLEGRDGKIFKADDTDLSKPWISLGRAQITQTPRLLYVSKTGSIFVSHMELPLYRSDDNGRSWRQCLDTPVWRMAEDDEGSIYAGNYTNQDKANKVATLYKSTDGGVTWKTIFRDPSNNHIHTVRWDDMSKRIYISFGDNPTRGQAYSDDRGATFYPCPTGNGRWQGHTDVSFTTDYIVWASDDNTGRLFLTDRVTGANTALLGKSQYMWWTISHGHRIYVGTMAASKGDQAALLVSSDQGLTWQKLVETAPAAAAYDQGFNAESRAMSSQGWIYFSAEGVTYRVRADQ